MSSKDLKAAELTIKELQAALAEARFRISTLESNQQGARNKAASALLSQAKFDSEAAGMIKVLRSQLANAQAAVKANKARVDALEVELAQVRALGLFD